MANWRLEIKKLFANKVLIAIPNIKKFGAWNNQKNNPDIEDTTPTLGVWFEYASVGDSLPYMLQTSQQRADKVPVEVTLHIMFNNYNDQAQDLAYQYADDITNELKGIKDVLISGQIHKSREAEDSTHRAAYDYQISFAFMIKESVFIDNVWLDVNPETEVDPNPETGRRLLVSLDVKRKTD